MDFWRLVVRLSVLRVGRLSERVCKIRKDAWRYRYGYGLMGGQA